MLDDDPSAAEHRTDKMHPFQYALVPGIPCQRRNTLLASTCTCLITKTMDHNNKADACTLHLFVPWALSTPACPAREGTKGLADCALQEETNATRVLTLQHGCAYIIPSAQRERQASTAWCPLLLSESLHPCPSYTLLRTVHRCAA